MNTYYYKLRTKVASLEGVSPGEVNNRLRNRNHAILGLSAGAGLLSGVLGFRGARKAGSGLLRSLLPAVGYSSLGAVGGALGGMGINELTGGRALRRKLDEQYRANYSSEPSAPMGPLASTEIFDTQNRKHWSKLPLPTFTPPSSVGQQEVNRFMEQQEAGITPTDLGGRSVITSNPAEYAGPLGDVARAKKMVFNSPHPQYGAFGYSFPSKSPLSKDKITAAHEYYHGNVSNTWKNPEGEEANADLYAALTDYSLSDAARNYLRTEQASGGVEPSPAHAERDPHLDNSTRAALFAAMAR